MTDKRKLNIVAGIAIVCFSLLAVLPGLKMMLEISIIPEVYEGVVFTAICFFATSTISIIWGTK